MTPLAPDLSELTPAAKDLLRQLADGDHHIVRRDKPAQTTHCQKKFVICARAGVVARSISDGGATSRHGLAQAVLVDLDVECASVDAQQLRRRPKGVERLL